MHIFLEKESAHAKHSFFCKIKPDTKQITLKNASDSPYAKGWENYAPFESITGKKWYRTKAGTYNGKEFTFSIKKTSEYACWFPPYTPNEKTLKLSTADNKQVIGNLRLPKIILLAAQHPGETMGLYFLEGILNALSKNKSILNQFCFVMFPAVNQAGIKAHTHRLTPDGRDLNRAWQTDCPELAHIKQEIAALKNIYALVDIHGDEVSKTDYVIYNKNFNQTTLATALKATHFQCLQQQSSFKKFLKNLIKHKKWIRKRGITARNYFEKHGICAITLELSAHQNTPETCLQKGSDFVHKLCSKKTSKI